MMNTVRAPTHGDVQKQKESVTSYGSRTLETIAAEIRECQETSKDSYLIIGRLLQEAKESGGG